MKETMQNKGLARRRFLALVGKSALGLWLLQLIPTGLASLKPAVRRKPLASRNTYAARIKEHPLAVKRDERG